MSTRLLSDKYQFQQQKKKKKKTKIFFIEGPSYMSYNDLLEHVRKLM